jgi:PAS domain S-box-containing protein
MIPPLSRKPMIFARFVLELAGISLAYIVLAKLGLRLALINLSASVVWPATGFALAMVLLRGLRIWPAVFIGALIVNATTAGSLLTSLAIASGNTLEAVTGGYLISRICGGTRTFDSPANVAKFALITIGPATLISATVGVSALRLGGFVEPSQVTSVWMTWWIGDFGGGLLLTPVIVLWAAADPTSLNRRELGATAMLLAAAFAVGLVVFAPPVTASKAPLGCLVMVPLVWVGLRRGQRDTATVALVLAGIAIWGATAVKPSDRSSISDAFTLVSMVIGAALPSLVLSAEVAVRGQAQERLRASEERFRGIFEYAGTGIAIGDMEGRLQSGNPAYCSMLGYAKEELRGLTIEDLVHPEDVEACLANFRSLVEQEIPSFEALNRYIAKDGEPVWVHKHVSLLRDDRGRPINAMALVTDVTERKRQENHINLLMREVNHRSKNMLSVVQAIARQTAAASPNDFLVRFEDRIQALASSQDLMVKNEWRGANLDDLIRSQLAHFQDLIGTRIEIQGPRLFISASAAQPIGMALHELATNAGKYGALADDDGRVKIEWNVEEANAGAQHFVMSWRERGMHPIAAPSARGFGSTVICEMAELSLDAKVDLDLAATGLIWQLRCPAGEVLNEGNSILAEEYERLAGSRPVKDARPRILVVEDEAVVALEIAQMLIEAGFQVVGPARAVNEALRLIGEAGCDAAVIDINLGSETSEPVALALKERAIPFLTVSGYSREQLPPVFNGIRALTKPLRPELLIVELRRCVEQGARRTKEHGRLPA